MTRSVLYTSSPLLASKTPLWRSKMIVAMLGLGFVGLGARAAYVQVFGNDFFQRQGQVRFARTLELPANRGRLLDRNGLILASSVPAASIWAIPEDVEQDDPEVKAKLKQLAALMEMPRSGARAGVRAQNGSSRGGVAMSCPALRAVLSPPQEPDGALRATSGGRGFASPAQAARVGGSSR